MSAVSRRVYLEWQAAQRELVRLREENARLVLECRLAYLEGLDQGRAGLEAAS